MSTRLDSHQVTSLGEPPPADSVAGGRAPGPDAAALTDRLSGRFPQHGREVVLAAVEASIAQHANSKVTTYLSILVERDVVEALQAAVVRQAVA